jgi:hypothetical protein
MSAILRSPFGRSARRLLVAIAFATLGIGSLRHADAQKILPPIRPFPPIPRIEIPKGEEEKPIQLTEMEVRAKIVGLNAEVTTTLTFLNPNSRILEGELVFPMPESAAVTGYALDIGGKMVDGVVVKKEKARMVFENEARRRVDPGIVEQIAGNVFRTRIYPLPVHGTRKVSIRSVVPLTVDTKGDAALHLPMPLGETISKLGIEIAVTQTPVKPVVGGFGNLRFESFENRWIAKTELQDAKPGEDLWVAVPQLPAQVSAIETTREGEAYFYASDLPALAKEAIRAKAPAHIGIAWDASGSRLGQTAKEIALVKEILALWPETKITLVIFRDAPEPAKVVGREELLKALEEAAYDGGTDLCALSKAMGKEEGVEQWLLFTDGVDTLSGALPDFGSRKVTAITSQTVAECELLRQVCGSSGGQLVNLQSMETPAAIDALLRPPVILQAVRGTGIAEVQEIGQVVRGRVGICGKLTAEATEIVLEYSDGHRSAPIKIEKRGAAEGDLLGAVWAGRRIAQLSVRPEENEAELVALGQRFGIVSPVTSLIVLENLDQYVRNDIEPPASLPEMRKQWAQIKSNQGKQQGVRETDKLQQVIAMWTARVNWWNGLEPKPVFMGSADATRGGSAGGGGALPSVDMSSEQLRRSVINAPAAPASAAAPAEARTMPKAAERNIDIENRNISPRITNAIETVAVPEKPSQPPGAAEASIAIKEWDPQTPYLRTIKQANASERYPAYIGCRKTNQSSPAFYLDCAEYFFRAGDREKAIRILSNLAELKMEDAGLLRVLAWRFQQAGELDHAIVILRKVAKMRSEEPQSYRDLALALAERGKARLAAGDISEAMALEQKVVLSHWDDRLAEIELFALEELNALIAWSQSQKWENPPTIPQLDEKLLKNLDEDIRIVMAWDADNTDVDLHVVEPSGEEAFYSHNRTSSGGLVSRDFTQGYGPEEYLIHKAKPGVYHVFAHYYGSHQTTLLGPVTITATVFTNFGRPSQKQEVLTLRLNEQREKAEIGSIRFKGAEGAVEANADKSDSLPADIRSLRVGQPKQEVLRLLGEPKKRKANELFYQAGPKQYVVRFSNDKVESVAELLPGGAEMILAQ